MVAALRADLGLNGDAPFVAGNAAAAPGTDATAPDTLSDYKFLTLLGRDWKPAFSDEFNGDKLDATKWEIGLPWGGIDGTGRHHNEHYASYIMDDDVAVRDGSLHLTTQRRDVTDKKGNLFRYSEGLITTAKTFRSSYGYFEARAKMPTEAGPGTWPAFWMLANGWPPEFDIVEYWGRLGRIHQGTVTRKEDGAQPWNSYNGYDLSIAGWYTYGLEWGPGYQHYNIDGKITNTIYGEHLAMPDMHYLLLNSGIETAQPPTASTIFSNSFEVDYARVYTRPDVPALNNGGFEMDGNSGWKRIGQATVVDYGARSGKRALRVDGATKPAAMSQTIYGLLPNTKYTLTAQIKASQAATAQLVARDFGGAPVTATAANSADYQPLSLSFTTGADATKATIACESMGQAFFDDLQLAK